MSKPTKRKLSDSGPAPGNVQVYNALTSLQGCMLPEEDMGGVARPPRHVMFKSGNNELSRADWDACKRNKAFRVLLEQGTYPALNGRTQEITPLVEGRFDKGQAAAESALTKRIEKAREQLSAEG